MQLFPLLLISLSFGIAVNEDAYEDNLNQFIDTNGGISGPKFSTTTRNKISSLSPNRHRSQLMADSDLLGDMSWTRFIQSFVDSASAMAEIAKSWANLAVKSQNESDDNTPEAAAAAVAAKYEKIRRRFCSPQRPLFLCCITYIQQIGVDSLDHIYDEFLYCGIAGSSVCVDWGVTDWMEPVCCSSFEPHSPESELGIGVSCQSLSPSIFIGL